MREYLIDYMVLLLFLVVGFIVGAESQSDIGKPPETLKAEYERELPRNKECTMVLVLPKQPINTNLIKENNNE